MLLVFSLLAQQDAQQSLARISCLTSRQFLLSAEGQEPGL